MLFYLDGILLWFPDLFSITSTADTIARYMTFKPLAIASFLDLCETI